MLFQTFCHFWVSCHFSSIVLQIYRFTQLLYRPLEIHFSFTFADKSLFLRYLALAYRINNGVHDRHPDLETISLAI